MAGTTTPSIALHISSTVASGRPMMAAIVDGFCSQAFCIAIARFETRLRPSSKLRAPAATSALNSPSECPAVISGLKSAPSDLARMTECRKIAG